MVAKIIAITAVVFFLIGIRISNKFFFRNIRTRLLYVASFVTFAKISDIIDVINYT